MTEDARLPPGSFDKEDAGDDVRDHPRRRVEV